MFCNFLWINKKSKLISPHKHEYTNHAILLTVVSLAANIVLQDDLLNEWALGSILFDTFEASMF